MEEMLKKILEKIQVIAKYHPDLKNAKTISPTIEVKIENDKFVISSITYNWYDIILVCPTGIFVIPEHGQRRTLFSYKNWEGLLEL